VESKPYTAFRNYAPQKKPRRHYLSQSLFTIHIKAIIQEMIIICSPMFDNQPELIRPPVLSLVTSLSLAMRRNDQTSMKRQPETLHHHNFLESKVFARSHNNVPQCGDGREREALSRFRLQTPAFSSAKARQFSKPIGC